MTELVLFMRLRWLAGFAVLGVVAFPFLRHTWLDRYGNENAPAFLAVGAVILVYNAILWIWLRLLAGRRHIRPHLLILACVQLLADLSSLTILTILTGGIGSPLRGFYVFHMVFCSLLLPQLMAFAGAAVAMLMLTAGLWITTQWPSSPQDNTSLLAWMVLLLVTVWLTNGITRNLRSQSHRLRKQNRHILAISRALKRQQSAMVQQEKMATAGRMASGVIHEIANPLASMDSLLQLIARHPDKVRASAVDTLREQVDRINGIIRRMTAFAHPGDGEWRLSSPNEAVERALEITRLDPRCKAVKIRRELAADLPPIRMLPDAMQQVLINLIFNAMDAMEGKPEPTLTIRTRAAGKSAVIEVIDNGHGITLANQSRLFDPFFTTKPVGKGTGLGLAIAYNFVQQHGGKIGVHSIPGNGATFSLHLPLPDSASEPKSAAIEVAVAESAEI
jgi:signal transduction histidine kinase